MGDDEELDDSMAANPEPVVDTGYRGRSSKAEKHGKWVLQFVETPPTPAAPESGDKHCASCNAKTSILHPIGNDQRRRFCGKCQGEANAARTR